MHVPVGTLGSFRAHEPSAAVVTLPDWQRSRGASLEVFVAAQLGLDVLPLDAALAQEGAA